MDDCEICEVPQPLQDEDKWFGLTKRQLLIVLLGILLTASVILFFALLSVYLIGVVFGVLILGISIFIAAYEVEPEKYIYGCGLHLEIILLRLLKKRLFKRNRRVYTRHYNDEVK